MSNSVTWDQLKALKDELTPPRSSILGTFSGRAAPPTRSHDVLSTIIGTPPETSHEIAKLKSALALLSADVPRGTGALYVGKSKVVSKDYWLLVIWAIRSLNWACGEAIAREWSMQCAARYKDGEGFDKAWNSYDTDRVDRVGIGCLYTLAQDHEWTPTKVNTHDAHISYKSNSGQHRAEYTVLKSSDIAAQPNTVWRVKGILPDRGVAAIYGESGSGKSFLALDLAAVLAEVKTDG